MRDIPLTVPDAAMPRHTFVNYGDTRSGKTVFGATFPRPIVFADVTEGGYSSIRTMNRDTWWEPNHEPIIKGIESMSDLITFLPQLQALVAAKRVYSVIFDAFSFYTDLVLNQLISTQAKPDMRSAYGTLGIHLRKVRTDLHSLGVNVMWNCLAKHPDTDDPKGRPLIPGQQSDKFSAGVDFLVHSRVEQFKEGGKVVATEHQIRTRQFGTYIVGNRLGELADQLPDPFIGSYSDFVGYLGYDVDELKAKMPKPGVVAQAAPKTATPPAAATKPAITIKPVVKTVVAAK